MRSGAILKMLRMMTYKFGDVVLVPFPFTDLSTAKQRPAAVASSMQFHQGRIDLILMATTGNTTGTPQRLYVVTIQDWKKSGLVKESVIKLVVFTIQKTLIKRKFGVLDQATVKLLRQIIPKIFG